MGVFTHMPEGICAFLIRHNCRTMQLPEQGQAAVVSLEDNISHQSGGMYKASAAGRAVRVAVLAEREGKSNREIGKCLQPPPVYLREMLTVVFSELATA